MRKGKAISIAFEGLYGAGKTTTIRRLSEHIDISNQRLWMGDGYNFSLSRSKGFSIEEWIGLRHKAFHELEAHCDYIFMERCAFADFQKLCFRRDLIDAERLWQLTSTWWPNRVVLIDTPVAVCAGRIVNRGDAFRADITDLTEFHETIWKTIDYLRPRLGSRLCIVPDSEAAYALGHRLIQEEDI